MQNLSSTLIVLATGGTIAGRAGSASDNLGYRSAELGVAELLHGIELDPSLVVEGEQVAQIDSKDMAPSIWLALATRAAHHLGRPEVMGLVVTHGTDTLEETAWLLHRVLAPAKPVVLTAAMRPATSMQTDGPQNLADALLLAAVEGACGVLAVLGGRVQAAADLRKRHSWRLDAFAGGDAGPVACIEQGAVRRFREWPRGQALGLAPLVAGAERWPWVEIVTSHAGACGAGVDALAAAGVQGLVVAGTGNGTVHQVLAEALDRAQARGVAVRVCSRCADGPVLAPPNPRWPVVSGLSPAQTRIDLWLELLQRGC